MRSNHCFKLEKVLARYNECGGQLNPKKCCLAQSPMKILGHVISKKGIDADPHKMKVLMFLPSSHDINQLDTFIQKVWYLSRFISLSYQLLYPLQQATKVDLLNLIDECEVVFQGVKEVLGSLLAVQAPK